MISYSYHSDLDKVLSGTGDKLVTFFQYMSTFFSGFTIGFVQDWRLTLMLLGVTPFLVVSGAIFTWWVTVVCMWPCIPLYWIMYVVCMYVCMCVCMYVCMCVCVYLCMCVCVYVHVCCMITLRWKDYDCLHKSWHWPEVITMLPHYNNIFHLK